MEHLKGSFEECVHKIYDLADENHFGFPRLGIWHESDSTEIYIETKDKDNRSQGSIAHKTTPETFDKDTPALTRIFNVSSHIVIKVRAYLDGDNRRKLFEQFYKTQAEFPYILVTQDPAQLAVYIILSDSYDGEKAIKVQRVYNNIGLAADGFNQVLVDLNTGERIVGGTQPPPIETEEREPTLGGTGKIEGQQ